LDEIARIDRRRLLAGGAAAGVGSLIRPAASRAEPATDQPAEVPASMRQQGSPVIAEPYGKPSPYEAGVVRRAWGEKTPFPTAGVAATPLQDLHGTITPNGLIYIRDHGGTPALDPAAHRLLVHGLVERPLLFSMDDLMRFPSVSVQHFLECSGNTPFWKAAAIKPDWTVQNTHGLLSCCEWTGVRLADVLGECGLRREAAWMLAEGADAAAMTRSVPVAKALDDALLVYAQNGEALRPEQGFPLRLFLPGYEGNMSVKWLRRLKLGEAPFQTREETSKYTGLLPDGTARQFVFVMEVKSVITRPSGGQRLSAPGFVEISGLAWSGRGRIARVDVSTDGGETWREAALQPPVQSKCLTRFRLGWHWDGGPARLASRAVDETGAVQPTRDALIAARGTNSYYHYNGIHAWQVAADGAVHVAAV
jgi:sulfane dehydrogenase subunit SoxC